VVKYLISYWQSSFRHITNDSLKKNNFQKLLLVKLLVTWQNYGKIFFVDLVIESVVCGKIYQPGKKVITTIVTSNICLITLLNVTIIIIIK
jgi:hypothetical protein